MRLGCCGILTGAVVVADTTEVRTCAPLTTGQEAHARIGGSRSHLQMLLVLARGRLVLARDAGSSGYLVAPAARSRSLAR